MGRSLPSVWVRWRRQRYKALVADGLPRRLAWSLARGEARGRHRVSRIIGNRAAQDAELTCVSSGGGLRFFLTGGNAGLTKDQVTDIGSLNDQLRSRA
jgi:hypothetical protein